MIVIFDNLSAMLVGASVMMILVGLQMRMTGMSVEQTSTFIVKNQASSLSTWFEEDLLRLGENIDKTKEVPFLNPTDSASVTTKFEFYRDSLDTSVNPPDTIRISTRYKLHNSGIRESDDDTITVYRIERELKVGAAGAWKYSGGSSPLMAHLKIEMVDADVKSVADPVAAMTADPLAVRNTRVRFSMVTPFENKRTVIRKVFYGSTLLIPN